MGLLQWLADMSFVKEKEGLQLGSLDKRYREPKYDPHEGFDYERKPREQKTSFEEMQAAKIPYKHRDYCSHLYLDFEACRKRNFPAGWRCHHEKHALDMCKYDEETKSKKKKEKKKISLNFAVSHVLRMREFEREKRIEEKRARADMGQA